MKRRKFIALAGGCVFGLGGMSMFPFVLPMKIREKSEENVMERILYLASLAPSSHNTQPWRIRIRSEYIWELDFERERCLLKADPHYEEMYLSLGAFLENLILAAEAFGYCAKWELREGELPVVITLTESNEEKHRENIEVMEKRRALRLNLLMTELSEREIADLLKNTEACQYYSQTSDIAAVLRALEADANRQQSTMHEVQEELSHWIRCDRREQERYCDGITPDTMEMNFFLKWLAGYFYRPEMVLSESFQKSGQEKLELQVKEGAGWLIVKARDASLQSLLMAGMQLESVWLRAAALGLGFHPMSQALEVEGIRQKLWEEVGENICFVARLGHVKEYPEPVSMRRRVADFAEEV